MSNPRSPADSPAADDGEGRKKLTLTRKPAPAPVARGRDGGPGADRPRSAGGPRPTGPRAGGDSRFSDNRGGRDSRDSRDGRDARDNRGERGSRDSWPGRDSRDGGFGRGEARGGGYGQERRFGDRADGGRRDDARPYAGRSDAARPYAGRGDFVSVGAGSRDPRQDGRRPAGPRQDDRRNDGPRGFGPRQDDRRNDGPRGFGPRQDDRRNDGPRGFGPRSDGPREGGPREGGPRSFGAGPRQDGFRSERPRDEAPRRDGPPPRREMPSNVWRADAPQRTMQTAKAQAQNEQLKAEGQVRVNKRMSDLGLCSRREGDAWIENGWVLVNGEVATMGQLVELTDKIEIRREAQDLQAQQVTILINKPMGYVSGQAEDGHEPAVVLVNPPNHWREDHSKTRFNFSQLKGLAPCGRLDIDSIGLLVMTQDGRIAKHIIGEDSEVEKEYLVRVTYGAVEQDVQQHFPEDKLALLRHGLSLDGEALLPAGVEWQNPEQLRFVLREGKKRQIRRMCEAVGLFVVGLKRIRIGKVVLGNLPVGQWRYLGENEQF
ncbi:pseudouridine synthase [Comamonas sp. JUb58]|uniref:pseudouridine synthase n=1 Tax=Comamonas sp. JUb58 TaxID=2485114 RepID=UPI00105C36DF|nr:pseudouridine synthase [Comamonas sp. JUb58]TDS84513.1 23S rRNA pseudouridine2604 synthase [Comamonas sp. JUb58]